MGKGKILVALGAVAVSGVGIYYAYKYFSAKSAAAAKNTQQNTAVDNIGKLWGDLTGTLGIGSAGSAY